MEPSSSPLQGLTMSHLSGLWPQTLVPTTSASLFCPFFFLIFCFVLFFFFETGFHCVALAVLEPGCLPLPPKCFLGFLGARPSQPVLFYFLSLILKQGLMKPRLVLNCWHSWEWPWTSDPPASISWVTGLQNYITTPTLLGPKEPRA